PETAEIRIHWTAGSLLPCREPKNASISSGRFLFSELHDILFYFTIFPSGIQSSVQKKGTFFS
ncbi:MAG: hypothetical protein IJY28_00495, partial [Clostridia bacterium]|nr:hypothetical protein [Clostridia bacterium]